MVANIKTNGEIGAIRSVKKKSSLRRAAKKRTLFLFFFLLIPISLFLVFYVGVNFNSFLLAFRTFENGEEKFAGLANFESVWKDIFVTGRLRTAITNSLLQCAVTLFLALPIQVVVSYAVFKKIPGSAFFKIMLFMPSMISAIVFVICARALINNGFPILFGNEEMNLLNISESSSFYTVLAFGFWFDLAGGMIIYLGAMSNVSKDVLEYGKLERMSSFKELIYVIVPSIFPTIVTYVIIGFTVFFTGYGHFFSFYGIAQDRPFETLGYVFFVKVADNRATQNDMSYAAAGGLLFTLVLAPLTIAVKSLLEKFGPSED